GRGMLFAVHSVSSCLVILVSHLSMIAIRFRKKTIKADILRAMFTFSWIRPLFFLTNMFYDRNIETVLVNRFL
ncbi:hypothetical protein BZG21_46910, partial [Escherichia coli]|nr:hypothetical protein [Escherichia coli]